MKNKYTLTEDHHTLIQGLATEMESQPDEILAAILELGIAFCVAAKKPEVNMNGMRDIVNNNKTSERLCLLLNKWWGNG
ncbi:MAG: hypothetical protein PHW73_00025 [Atribacterota bacterium]|nr:hypothetical protein [Atribacterota bacterium]